MITIATTLFQRIARTSSLCMSRDATKDSMRGLHIKGCNGVAVIFESTDGHCLIRWTLGIDDYRSEDVGPIDVIIPRPSLRVFLFGLRVMRKQSALVSAGHVNVTITPTEIRSGTIVVQFSQPKAPFPPCDLALKGALYPIEAPRRPFSISASNMKRVSRIFEMLADEPVETNYPVVQSGPTALDPILFTCEQERRIAIVCMPLRNGIDERVAAARRAVPAETAAS